MAALAALSYAPSAHSQRPEPQVGVSYLAVDLQSGTTLASERVDRLDAAILPGSVVKIATLAAALEAGVIGGHTGILCTRQIDVAGHHLTCTHPDLHRPLSAAEALAHSCNTFFATIAARVPRSALDRVLTSLGLPPTDPAVSVQAAALGVEGIRVSPRRLVEMMARVAAEPSPLPWTANTLAVVREGLRGAATFGTATAFNTHGVGALAKTGTTVGGAGAQGLVVGVTPSSRPVVGFVLLASGGAGVDAADLAARRLARMATLRSASTVRLGEALIGGGYRTRSIALDDYVAGVVAGEAAPGSSPAALEALAITVRTFTEANRGRHADDGFDLCDLTHCQVWRAPTTAATRAATSTAGLFLLDHGAAAHVFYSSSCGGHTERPSAVWRGAPDPEYLPARPDDACGGVPAWSSEIRVGDLMRALRTGRFQGDTLREMSVRSRTSSGRVAWLRLDGFAPADLSGDDLRTLVGRTLGWQHIRSTAFDVTRTGAGFRFTGHGAGHGVGLCVVGATRLAEKGTSAKEILAKYFPGLTVARRPGARPARSTDVAVLLPAADRGETAALQTTAQRTVDSLMTSLGVEAPVRLTLRFHPTVESYQRQTGQPWFTAAATRGTVVDFVPLAGLRQRGVVESTLAHELVHVMTESALVGRPRWVVEGAASYYAGERVDDTGATCPSDDALARPVSQEALGRAMGQATACVARALRAGTPWRELR